MTLNTFAAHYQQAIAMVKQALMDAEHELSDAILFSTHCETPDVILLLVFRGEADLSYDSEPNSALMIRVMSERDTANHLMPMKDWKRQDLLGFPVFARKVFRLAIDNGVELESVEFREVKKDYRFPLLNAA